MLRRSLLGLELLVWVAIFTSRTLRTWLFTRARQRLITCLSRDLLPSEAVFFRRRPQSRPDGPRDSAARRASSPLALVPPPCPVVSRKPMRTTSRRQVTTVSLQHSAVLPSVTQGRSHRLLCLMTFAQLSPRPPHSARICLKSPCCSLLPVTVKDTGDLLLLCDWIFEEIGSPYMWIIMLSVVEWDTLTAEQKDLYSTAHNLSCTQGGTEAQIPAARPARSCLQARC